MSMPETAVYENYCKISGKNKVRFSRIPFVADTISKTSLEKGRTNLKTILGEHVGFTPVYVQLKKEKQARRMSVNVDLNSGIEEALKLEYGADRVIVRDSK